MIETNTIYNESCLDTLARMPDESIDCVVTSPPYYGLRSYGTEPQVWGNHNGCSHVWQMAIKPAANGIINGAMQGETLDGNSATRKPSEYAFCLNCNAWRGELGLEPTFQLYISHLIDIFREVKRALKPSGTVWVNLGDSYPTHAGGVVDDPMRASGLAGTKHQEVARKTSALGQYKKGGRLPEKCLMNIPARFAIAMTDNPYTLRPDLTEEQRTYVIIELMKRGII